MSRWIVVWVSCVVLGGCSSPSTTIDLGKSADANTDQTTKKDAVEINFKTDVVEAHAAPETLAEVLDGGTADVPQLQCDPGGGCFQDECSENSQCQSGWCVEHMGEMVCTQPCQEECPQGWTCTQVAGTAPDLVFVCVSDYPNICRPCAEADDCAGIAGTDDACVAYGDQGNFCGGKCGNGETCPWGFECKTVSTLDGIELDQCVAETGQCPCTDTSVELGLFTPCLVTNEFGTCHGKRVCTEDGLTDCNAAIPAEETCNGLDDDCDEETDEPPLMEGEYGSLCDDDNACTEDKCKAEDGCENLPTDGAECMDGDPCTMADHCVQDVCVGTPAECKDDNPCTDDGCDDTGGCVFTPNDDACNDGNPCTVGDQCKETECIGTELPCDCQTNADCAELEDGNVCNGTLICGTDILPYECEVDAATTIECDPPEEGPDAVCQQAHCVPETGDCQLVPANEGFACDDANACTAGDKCVEGTCTPGIAINCADDNPCTDDSCDAVDGCLHAPNEVPCSDGSVCTVNDTCKDSQCDPGVDLDCNDNNPCTADSCDPAAGCTHDPAEEPCDDGNACTVGDHCEVGVCGFDSVDSCNDGNPCTSDSCDPVQGCVNDTVAGPCSDNDPCTLNDLCVDGQCVSGAPTNCDDGNPCTEDKCDEVGKCENNPMQADCNDGNACTKGDHCDEGLCMHVGLTNCDDGDVCTTDNCDPVNGCTYSTNENVCSDGSICTVGDQCVDGSCAPGDSIECDDGNDCTDDVCDNELGCVFTLNQAECDDGDVCTTGDTCSLGACAGSTCGELGLFCSKDGCADKVCSSLAFDGDGDFVAVPHSPELNLNDTSYTIEAWVWFEKYSPLWVNAIVSKFAGSGATRLGWVFMVGGKPSGIGPGSLAVGHYYGEGTVPVATAIASPKESVPTLQWVHAAVTFDMDTQTGKVWLNGEVAGEVIAEPVPPTNFDLHIGSMRPAPCPNCYHWDGFIDEVRVSSTTRYTEQFEPIAQLIPDDDTLALWDFNEGQGGIAHDISGNGHDGLISGATWSENGPPEGCCVPQCEGKECGGDGCGGSCGGCVPDEPASCTEYLCASETGTCNQQPKDCDDGNPCTTDSCELDLDAGDVKCIFSPNEDWMLDEAPSPVVLLVLDTSASMEYAVQAAMGEAVPICHEQKQPAFQYVKSRWTAVVEALTGTFLDYWCMYDPRTDDPLREDYGFPIPHVVPMGVGTNGKTQNQDGLLDEHAGSVKFALMAFDPQLQTATGASGGYSYGPDKQYMGMSVNLGSRNENAVWGALVPPPATDEVDALEAVGATIQQQILASTPYAGTPTSPALDDALHFFANDDAFAPYDPQTGIGDMYSSCRKKLVILITDGAPNLGEGTMGYLFAEMAAANLLAEGIEVYVVAFQIPASVGQVMDSIALSGGTGEATIVSSSDKLRPAVESILLKTMGQ